MLSMTLCGFFMSLWFKESLLDKEFWIFDNISDGVGFWKI